MSSAIGLDAKKTLVQAKTAEYRNLDTDSSEEDYIAIIEGLISLDIPNSVYTSTSGTLPGDIGYGGADMAHILEIVGATEEISNMEDLKANVFGWMNGTRIKDVHMPGIYALGAYEITDSNSRALRISRKFGTNDLDYLYLEYRKPIGFDTSIGAKPVVNSILVHINQILPLKLPLSSRMQFSSGLIDTTPTVPESRLDPALKYGKKFRDKNLEVAFIYKDDRRAYIAVQYFCEDGTALGQCSTSKPNYCDYSTGSANHINKCSACGCPSGYACRADESCSRIIFQSAET